MKSLKERRRRIREAYLALVKETGEEAISTRAIAAKTGLSVNGVSQSLGAMEEFKVVDHKSRNGGDWTHKLKEDDGV